MNLKNPFHSIPACVENDAKEINVLLEITCGDSVKYEYDKDYGMVMVDRILKTPMPYPFNYGLIPQTWNEFDNDPLDVIILGNKTEFLKVINDSFSGISDASTSSEIASGINEKISVSLSLFLLSKIISSNILISLFFICISQVLCQKENRKMWQITYSKLPLQ